MNRYYFNNNLLLNYIPYYPYNYFYNTNKFTKTNRPLRQNNDIKEVDFNYLYDYLNKNYPEMIKYLGGDRQEFLNIFAEAIKYIPSELIDSMLYIKRLGDWYHQKLLQVEKNQEKVDKLFEELEDIRVNRQYFDYKYMMKFTQKQNKLHYIKNQIHQNEADIEVYEKFVKYLGATLGAIVSKFGNQIFQNLPKYLPQGLAASGVAVWMGTPAGAATTAFLVGLAIIFGTFYVSDKLSDKKEKIKKKNKEQMDKLQAEQEKLNEDIAKFMSMEIPEIVPDEDKNHEEYKKCIQSCYDKWKNNEPMYLKCISECMKKPDKEKELIHSEELAVRNTDSYIGNEEYWGAAFYLDIYNNGDISIRKKGLYCYAPGKWKDLNVDVMLVSIETREVQSKTELIVKYKGNWSGVIKKGYKPYYKNLSGDDEYIKSIDISKKGIPKGEFRIKNGALSYTLDECNK